MNEVTECCYVDISHTTLNTEIKEAVLAKGNGRSHHTQSNKFDPLIHH